jgi:hypothetical protein
LTRRAYAARLARGRDGAEGGWRSTFVVGGEHAAQLLVIDVVNAHGAVILQTVWAPKDQLRYGRRETRSETIRDQGQLIARLAELVPEIAGHLPARAVAAA